MERLWSPSLCDSFAPNRAYFSRRVEGSTHQALLNSLLSVLASLGGVVGPVWLGATIGRPMASGPVAQVTFIGCMGLVAFTMLVFGVTTMCPKPVAHQADP
eukprot:1751222-Prymnesium_polylepis.1